MASPNSPVGDAQSHIMSFLMSCPLLLNIQTLLNSDQHLEDRPAVSSPPWVWFGFVFAIAFRSAEFADLILDCDKQCLQLIFALIVLGGWIYWLFLCPPI